MEGVNSLIVANDVRGEGHFTDYPSDKPSVALQIPFTDGKLPQHRVLNDGVCAARDVIFEDGTDVFEVGPNGARFGGQTTLR